MPLLAAAAIAALVLAVAFAALALTGRRSDEGPPTDLLGSALPERWLPGEGRGAGSPPPPPPGVSPAAPAGGPLPVPELPPYSGPEPSLPLPGAEATPVMQTGGSELDDPVPTLQEPETSESERVESFEPPRLLAMPEAVYPRMARRRRIEATVTLRVRISTTGRVIEAEPIGELVGYGLDGEARRVARRAAFAPARRDGVPVVADTRLAVVFRLD